MEKSLIQKFQSEIKKDLIKKAKNSFKVEIEADNIIIASDSLSFGIAIALLKKKNADTSQFALINIFKSSKEKKILIPNGTYLIGRKGKVSFLFDEMKNSIAKGNVHPAPKEVSARVGKPRITIGDGKVCIYWIDPIGSGGQCHCHCFIYRKPTPPPTA